MTRHQPTSTSDPLLQPQLHLSEADVLFAMTENEAMLRRYILALSGDASTIDDLSQEVFVRFMEKLHRLHDQSGIGPFLRGIARHVVRENLRKRRRSLRYVHLTAESMVDDGDTAAASCDTHTMLLRLRSAIETLPVVSRRMIELRYHDGKTAEEIGAALGIQPTAVRVSLLRIRDRLRVRLDPRSSHKT